MLQPPTEHPTAAAAPPQLLQLAAGDNVAVLTAACDAGTQFLEKNLVVVDRIAIGHKVALVDIAAGDKILKFGCPIGSATQPIRAGQHVHTHNLKSAYIPTFTLDRDRQFIKE